MEALKTFARENNIKITEEQVFKLEQFSDILIETNKVINLTAITDKREIEIKHMVDSLEAARLILESNVVEEKFSIVDVGCGAGFPGIPLKILFSNAEVTLLDSLNKKINFVNNAIKQLELENTVGIAMRAEDFAKTEKREYFDFCTSRAVAKMNVLLEYCLPMVKIGGTCLIYKSADYENELEEAKAAIRILGGKVDKILKVSLPENMGERCIIAIRKVKETPKKYPRKAGMPSKCPIV